MLPWQVRKGEDFAEEVFIICLLFAHLFPPYMILIDCIKDIILFLVLALMLTLQTERIVYVSV